MGRKLFLIIIAMIAVYGSSAATIINIPDDYPTIQEGIDASSDGDTVLVQPGTYVENINFNGHNIVLGSLFLTTGDTTYIEQTIIDGDSSGSVVTFESGESSTAIIAGFVVQNGLSASLGGGISCVYSDPTITNNHIRANSAIGSQMTNGTGGGIYCFHSDATIIYNTISGNVAVGYPIWTWGTGGGIYCYNSNAKISNNFISENDALSEWGFGGGLSLFASSPTMINNVIIANSALHWGGGIHCYESSPIIVNNALSGNSAGVSGGGIYCELVSNPVITNTIFWADSASYESEIDFDDSSSPYFTYCDVQGGRAGEGNIDTDPLFRGPENGDFHLMSTQCGDPQDSPCIDAGDPIIFDSIIDCNRGLGGERSDMGAYGGGDSTTVGISDQPPRAPDRFALLQNYPNPFNASTSIEFTLPEETELELAVYDLLGRKVAMLFEGVKSSGHHSITWNAGNFSSGIYFARITNDLDEKSIKLILLK